MGKASTSMLPQADVPQLGNCTPPAARLGFDPVSMSRPLPVSLRDLLECRRPLLLQGPMGPFFARLADFLERHGQTVRKVNFNGGDAWFYRRPDAQPFRGDRAAWPAWLRQAVQEHRIDAIVLFGQTRPLHAAALAVARELGIPAFVFEEGYLRPDYVTLERGGVNLHSSLPRTAAAYRTVLAGPLPHPAPTGQHFSGLAKIAIQYYMASWLTLPWFPGHSYHRPLNPFQEGLKWVRGGWRKIHYARKEKHWLRVLTSDSRSGRWFLLPLQVATDSQILHHSHFQSMTEALSEVIASFAEHAPPDTWLVVKHHPMDRPYNDYTRLVASEAARHGVQGRVVYIHDLHLPTLLKHCRGVVTVNSTTGLQALYHKAPVCTLAPTFYAVPGLVHTGPLAQFWRRPGRVDVHLYQRFQREVVRLTQLNASFYAGIPAFEPASAEAAPPEEPAWNDPANISEALEPRSWAQTR